MSKLYIGIVVYLVMFGCAPGSHLETYVNVYNEFCSESDRMGEEILAANKIQDNDDKFKQLVEIELRFNERLKRLYQSINKSRANNHERGCQQALLELLRSEIEFGKRYLALYQRPIESGSSEAKVEMEKVTREHKSYRTQACESFLREYRSAKK